MSEYFKDELAVVIGTVLVMLVWLVMWGGTYRLLPMDPRSAESQPVSAVGTKSVAPER